MPFTYNSANVTEHHTFELPPPGDYTVKITDARERISKSGNNMMEIICEIQHPQHKGKLWEYVVDNEYANQRIYDILTSCGITPKEGMTILPGTFIGKTGRVKVKHETSNGETRLRLNYWIRPDKAPTATAETASKSTTNDKLPF